MAYAIRIDGVLTQSHCIFCWSRSTKCPTCWFAWEQGKVQWNLRSLSIKNNLAHPNNLEHVWLYVIFRIGSWLVLHQACIFMSECEAQAHAHGGFALVHYFSLCCPTMVYFRAGRLWEPSGLEASKCISDILAQQLMIPSSWNATCRKCTWLKTMFLFRG